MKNYRKLNFVKTYQTRDSPSICVLMINQYFNELFIYIINNNNVAKIGS